MSDNPTPSANCKKPNIMSIAVSVTSRSGKALGSFQLDANATVADLKAQYAKASSFFSFIELIDNNKKCFRSVFALSN
jgi:hypothetical protein